MVTNAKKKKSTARKGIKRMGRNHKYRFLEPKLLCPCCRITGKAVLTLVHVAKVIAAAAVLVC